ncbi:MAG: DedA family protein, partial [Rhodobacteraceae bacterium]|nr:DedA family protein [Paracoccaceae bacterium]
MYLSLFISAFAAATILPAQSEALLAYQVSISPDAVVQLVAIATLGNVLGATFNWWLGRLTENLRAKKWFPVNEKQLHKAERFYGRYGRYSLLLSWVPIIGDPITVVAGILREPLLSFVLLVTVAKCARYVFV